jgi:hypothetical protein
MPSGPGLRRQARRAGGGSGVNGIRRRRIRSAAQKVVSRNGSTCPRPDQRPFAVTVDGRWTPQYSAPSARMWHGCGHRDADPVE